MHVGVSGKRACRGGVNRRVADVLYMRVCVERLLTPVRVPPDPFVSRDCIIRIDVDDSMLEVPSLD